MLPIRLRRMAFRCCSLSMAPWPGLCPLGYMRLGEGGCACRPGGFAIPDPGGSDEELSSPDSEAVLCKRERNPNLVAQACYINYREC